MKNLFVKIIGVAVILTIMLNSIVIAATQSELQDEKNQTRSKINETQEELQGVQTEKSETQQQVDSLNNQIGDYQREIDELDVKIDELNTDIEEAEANLNKAQEEYEKQEDLLEQRLVVSYEAGNTSYLDFILSSENIIDLISNYYLVTEVASYDAELMDKIDKQKKDIEEAKKQLETDKSELDTSKASKESKTKQLAVIKDEKNEKVEQLSASEKDLQKELQELQSSISSKIKIMQQEYDRKMKAQQSSKPSGGNGNGNSGSSNAAPSGATSSHGFGWPVANPIIGTGYGVSGSMWSSGKHTGLDFRASTGTPVFAVGDGVVVDVGHTGAYGNSVTIYHGNNIFSLYAHASSVSVSEGQSVSKGQRIMLSGATGNVSGPHLHFEIRTPANSYYNTVNPRPYLP